MEIEGSWWFIPEKIVFVLIYICRWWEGVTEFQNLIYAGFKIDFYCRTLGRRKVAYVYHIRSFYWTYNERQFHLVKKKLNNGLTSISLWHVWTPSKALLGVRATSKEDWLEKCFAISLCFVSQGIEEDLWVNWRFAEDHHLKDFSGLLYSMEVWYWENISNNGSSLWHNLNAIIRACFEFNVLLACWMWNVLSITVVVERSLITHCPTAVAALDWSLHCD